MREYLESYLSDLRANGHPQTTCHTYGMACALFLAWRESQEGPPEVDKGLLNRYVEYLRRDRITRTGQGLRPRTIRCQLTAILQFCRWLEDQGHAEGLPLRRQVRLPGLDEAQRNTPTEAEMRRVWEWLERLPQGTAHRRFVRQRSIAVVGLLAYAGLRRAELLALNVTDLRSDRAPWVVQVRAGKGGRSDWVPLGDDLQALLREWLEEREEWLKGRQGTVAEDVRRALFPISRSRRMDTGALDSLFADLNDGANLSRRITPHCLRSYFGTSLQARGVPLADVSRLLRHQSLASTWAYLKWSDASISEGANRLQRDEPEPPVPAPAEPEPEPPAKDPEPPPTVKPRWRKRPPSGGRSDSRP